MKYDAEKLKTQSRTELLDTVNRLLYENERLSDENERLLKRLKSRSKQFRNADSLADAAVVMTSLIERMQVTADRYLQNIEEMKEKALRDTEQAEKMLQNARRMCRSDKND